MTRVFGGISGLRLPTELTPIIMDTPNSLKALRLARWLIRWGGIVSPILCRGKKTISSDSKTVTFPNRVDISNGFAFSERPIRRKAVPAITPVFAIYPPAGKGFSIRILRRKKSLPLSIIGNVPV
jgi:hypothetical protein